jgi:glycine oxidase
MPSLLPEKTEVAIIGGGIIGLAIAFELVQRGKQVTVLERDRVGRGATWAAAGMLATAAEAEGEDAPLVRLAAESKRIFPQFVASVEKAAGLSCGFREEGTLVVALGHDDELDLDHLRAAQAARGLASQRLSAEEVFQREPQLSGWVTGGLFVPDDSQVDSRAFAQALATAVRSLGGTITEGALVESLERRNGRVGVINGRMGDKEISVQCESAVIAAGAWSTVAFPDLGTVSKVRPVKGHTIRLRGPHLISHVVRTPDVYIFPRAGGEIVVGATTEEQGFDATPLAGAVLDLLRHAWRALPGLYDLEFLEVTTGFRPMTRSHLPMMGALREEGAFIATGHGRHGIFLAPATAALMADLIAEGKTSDLLVEFQPLPPMAGRNA